MSEYGVVRRHRGDGSAGFANKTADPIKNLRYIYIEGSYNASAKDQVNFLGIDPTGDPATLNFFGQYGGPLQWTPGLDSLGMSQSPGLDPSAPDWGHFWNIPGAP